jgi:hypothetical protein
MKITATQIKSGMTIKVTALYDKKIYTHNAKEGIDFSIGTSKFLKKSPVYKVLTVSEVITTGAHKTQHKTVAEKHIEITLEGVNGICSISPKKKVMLIA